MNITSQEMKLAIDALKVYKFELQEEIREYPDSCDDEKETLERVEKLKQKFENARR